MKVLHREGQMIRLEAKNVAHKDIVVPSGTVTIQGEVVYTIRQFKR